MNKLQMGPAIGGRPAPRFYLRVQRSARPPMPWVWEISRDGEASAFRRAVRGYRSAEDAWEAGRVALARLERQASSGC